MFVLTCFLHRPPVYVCVDMFSSADTNVYVLSFLMFTGLSFIGVLMLQCFLVVVSRL